MSDPSSPTTGSVNPVDETKEHEPEGPVIVHVPHASRLMPSPAIDETTTALGLIAKHHANQVDKLDKPYVLHLLRVASNVTPAARPAALLHDIVEDTAVTRQDLLDQGFSQDTCDAISAVTKPDGADYLGYVRSLLSVPGPAGEYAREIKRSDLTDNLSEDRRRPGDEESRERYRAALAILDSASAPPSR
ncbi:MAG: hypothetical protein JHD02_03675 [Thermoleophilaceae bacterium]|nr:hypothetical protein [Thermoleophilaceae bacterium]